MIVTVKDIKDYTDDDRAIDYFLKAYPDGIEFNRLICDDKTPHYVLWAVEKMPLTKTERTAVQEALNIKDSKTIFLSRHVRDSEYINRSTFVKNSNFIHESHFVERSVAVHHSTDVLKSTHVYFSTEVNTSNYIVASTSVRNSNFISYAERVFDSSYIYHGYKVHDSYMVFGATNCRGCYFSSSLNQVNPEEAVANKLFCHNPNVKEKKANEPMVFNTPVSDVVFEQLKTEAIHIFEKYSSDFGNISPSKVGQFVAESNDSPIAIMTKDFSLKEFAGVPFHEFHKTDEGQVFYNVIRDFPYFNDDIYMRILYPTN